MLLRYKIKPVSPVMTPLMSDTFFGHFCWALKYSKGEKYLEDFLSLYKKDSLPPVLFSSAFKTGCLPRPVLPLLPRRQVSEFVKKYFIDDPDKLFKKDLGSGSEYSEKQKKFEGLSIFKKWNKQKLIYIDDWKILKNSYSESRLQELFYDRFKNQKKQLMDQEQEQDQDQNSQEIMVTEVTTSNTIDRVTGTVPDEGGGLFSREKTWFKQGIELDLYVKINSDEFLANVKWFLTDYLPGTGFGKDKSTGMGFLDINEDNEFNSDIFNVDSANACMTLSFCSFKGMEKYKSFYRLKTKFGRLGGDFAVSSPTGGNTRPFKKPILMMEPGSIFFTPRIEQGELIDNIHSDARIRHCGLPVTLPVKIMEDE